MALRKARGKRFVRWTPPDEVREDFYKFLHKVEYEDARRPHSSCWFWQGPFYSDGRPKFKHQGEWTNARRFAWLFRNGPIPRYRTAAPSCGVAHCVNPNHTRIGFREKPHKRFSDEQRRHIQRLREDPDRMTVSAIATLYEVPMSVIENVLYPR